MSRKNSSGFTIVETIIVVVIIGILASIGGFSYSRINASTRDNERASKIQAIAVALEKYYEEHGEYPSCNEMSQPADAITSSVLVGASRDVFTTPTDTSGDSSFISLCGDLTSNIDAFAYIGDESNACLNATDDSAACVEYTLKYKEESTGNIIAIESRHKIVDIALPTSSPILSVALNSTNVVATVTPVTCTEGTPQYSFNSRTNDGSWLGWTNWSDVTLTASQVANQGVKYGYQARTRCYINILKLSDSITTAESTYIHPISAPAAPVVSANTVGNTTTWSWPAITCPASTTTQYQYQYTTTYGYNSGWVGPQTALSIAFTTASEGFSYTTYVQARCYTAFTSGSWTASGSATYARPVTQGLGISVALNGANVQATISPAYTCTTGTAEYAFRSRIDDGTFSAYSAWATTTTSAQAANDGYKYGYQAQARCNASGNYSGIATSSENTYTDPIPTRTMSAVTNSTPAGSTTWSWTAVACPAGSTTQYQWRLNAGSWSAAQTGLSTTAVGTSTAGTYTVDVQARCFHDATTDVYSSWSASSSSSYVRPTYALTVVAGTGGTVTGGGSYNYGSSIAITATPNTGYHWTSWTGAGCPTTEDGNVTVNANMTCTANFAINTYTLTVSAGTGGTAAGSGTFNYNTTPAITATPNTGYRWTSWTGTGCPATEDGNVTAMTANKTCTANFIDPALWIAIGTQVWAKYNLNVGTRIDGVAEQTNNGGTNIVEKYCHSNLEANCTTYGGLYQWNEAMAYSTTESAQGICPAGSHIPSDNEWKILEMYLGMTQEQADATGVRGTDQGTQLQPGGSSGMNVPLAGFRSIAGSFYSLSSYPYLWSSSESGGNAWYRYGAATVNRSTYGKAAGFSVRCVGN